MNMIHTCFLVKQFVGTPAAFETFLKTQERFVAFIINVLYSRDTNHDTNDHNTTGAVKYDWPECADKFFTTTQLLKESWM